MTSPPDRVLIVEVKICGENIGRWSFYKINLQPMFRVIGERTLLIIKHLATMRLQNRYWNYLELNSKYVYHRRMYH